MSIDDDDTDTTALARLETLTINDELLVYGGVLVHEDGLTRGYYDQVALSRRMVAAPRESGARPVHIAELAVVLGNLRTET